MPVYCTFVDLLSVREFTVGPRYLNLHEKWPRALMWA